MARVCELCVKFAMSSFSDAATALFGAETKSLFKDLSSVNEISQGSFKGEGLHS